MNKKISKFELLAPAGNFPMLMTAINAGANAIYFGLQEFNMRDNAKNFKVNDLDKIKKICDENKIKSYLTLNTIIYNEELKKLENLLKKVKNKVDAIICWDPSIINLCNKYKIPFHVSTQASVSNVESAKFYKKLGAERIVPARELSLKQIKEISEKSKIALECFIHGAMCVSVSGRCFTSQFLFNSSANRGKCLQPCRRTYTVTDEEGNKLKIKNKRVFSAKDLCTLPFIEKLKKSGITSFKIEGRNRDVRYVDAVVRTYRKALNKKLTKNEIKNSLRELEKVYNRKLSSGFYLKIPTSDDFSNTENSSATEKKHFVGKVAHYYPKIKVITIKLVSKLKVNDKIIITGKMTGIEKTEIKRIEIENESVKKGEKGEEIAIKVPNKVRKNDEVYIILKNK